MDGFLDQNTGFLPPTAGAAASMAIAGAISGGTAGRVLFEGAGPVLSDAAGFTYATTSGITMSTDDAATATSLVMLSLEHTSSGTAAAGFGTGILFKAESAGGTSRSIGQLDSILTTATDATEISALVLKLAQAGTLTEVARFGGVAPAVDFQVGFGRVLLDARTTDTANFSHRSQTGTTVAALQHSATGQTNMNCTSGQSGFIQVSGTNRFRWNSTGIAFFTGSAVAQQTVGANVNNVVASGTTGQFDDFTSGTVYATDYAALHATVSQLCRTVAQMTVAMRAYGLGA